MMKRVIIYIGGYGRSGSTLLDAFLSSSSGVFGLGECVNFKEAVAGEEVCECGKNLRNCLFWSDFFVSHEDEKLTFYSKITTRFDSVIKSNKQRQSYNGFWSSLFQYARNRSSCSALVDSSKTTRKTFWRAKNLLEAGEDVAFIYLYKDPLDLIASLRKGSNKHLSGLEGQPYSTRFLLQSFLGWIIGNFGAVLSCRRFGRGRRVLLNYRDFAENPLIVIEKLGDVDINLSAPASFQNGHGISGNRARSKIEEIKYIEPDPGDFTFKEKFLMLLMACLLPIFILCAGLERKPAASKR